MDIKKKIKESIKSSSTLKKFSEQNGIRLATLSDFFSGKTDIQTSTFLKIVRGVDYEINPKIKNQPFFSKPSVNHNSNIYNIGDRVRLHNTTFYLTPSPTHIIKNIFNDKNVKGFLFQSISTGELQLILF